MPKVRESNLTAIDLTRINKRKLKCKKCGKKFKIGDKVSFVRQYTNKGHSLPYHKDCWESTLY